MIYIGVCFYNKFMITHYRRY